MVAEVRERLAVTKRLMQKFHVERYCVSKLNEAESIDRYQVKNLNRFTTSENFYDDVDINRTCEIIGEDIHTNFSQREMFIVTNRSSVSHGSMKDIKNC